MKKIISRFKEQVYKQYKKPALRKALIFIDCIILIGALGFLGRKLFDYYSNQRLYESIGKMYKSAQVNSNEEGPSIEGSVPRISVKFNDILKINGDTVGWINIENTKIDYPVVQSKENEFYLSRNFEKKDSSVGAIFMDFRNKIQPLDRNIILYGHQMKDGSMFKDLSLYKNKDFFNENKIITFNTLYQESRWEIFSVYVADAKFDYLITEFANDEEYFKYISKIKSKSEFKNDVQVSVKDHILTLSTCSYEFSHARTVVHARLIK